MPDSAQFQGKPPILHYLAFSRAFTAMPGYSQNWQLGQFLTLADHFHLSLSVRLLFYYKNVLRTLSLKHPELSRSNNCNYNEEATQAGGLLRENIQPQVAFSPFHLSNLVCCCGFKFWHTMRLLLAVFWNFLTNIRKYRLCKAYLPQT